MSPTSDHEFERRRAVYNIRAATTETDGRTVVGGLASVWGSLNSYGEVFVPGAFADDLAEITDQSPLVMGWQHSEPIGLWAIHEERIQGLYLEGPISQTSTGQDASILVNDGAVTGLSIGFWPETYQYAEAGQRVTFTTPFGDVSYQFEDSVIYVTEAEIVEASLVMAPADDMARLSMVRERQRGITDPEILLRRITTALAGDITLTTDLREAAVQARAAINDALGGERSTELLSQILAEVTCTTTSLKEATNE